MRKYLPLLLVFYFFTFTARFVFSQSKPADGFEAFFRDFQGAVAQNDAEKVASLSNFPRFRWEPLTDQDIKTKEEFLKKFSKMFSPAMKKKIASAKPSKTSGGDYLFDWIYAHEQYTLAFDHQPGGGFKFSGLLRGPE